MTNGTKEASRPFVTPTFAGLARRWLLPSLLAVVICIVGAVSVLAIRQSTQKNLKSKLTTILQTDIKALTIWTDERKRNTEYLAHRPEMRSAISALISETERTSDLQPVSCFNSLAAIEGLCQDASRTFGYVEYRVVNLDGRVLVDSDRSRLNARLNDVWLPQLDLLRRGATVFVKPLRQSLASPYAESEKVQSRPLLWVAAPIYDMDGKVVAAIALGIPPEHVFTEILSVARAGDSGETFAFDDEGWLLSDSRFDRQLQQLGRLGDTPNASAVLNVRSQNASGAMTEIVASAIEARQRSDFNVIVDLKGSTDYRDIRVVGASQWLPQFDFGVVTKLDYDEAFAPSLLLRNIVASLLTLSLIGVAGNLLFARRLARLLRRALRAEDKVRQLGQYTLVEKIGEGGMGEVYRARHAMLRRPTAVKLLRADRSSVAAIARFEQEVQLTAMLTHPNTIAIYDYGRTPDGTFYYAMEYLHGLDLSRVVKIDGPQAPGRVIAILRQVCNSLSEAHEAGLIHRDIKPGNVILFRRGSCADIVKVLDFGLVRNVSAIDGNPHDKSLAGTPAYMSPESFRTPGDVDARSDIYAVGAIGYFLLTGTHAVEASNAAIQLRQFNDSRPLLTPSQKLGRPVDPELSNVLMNCLKANRNDRPQSAAELATQLVACSSASHWSRKQSSEWWDSFKQLGSSAASDDQENEIGGVATLTADWKKIQYAR